MKILGIRNYSDGIRYCILEGEKDSINCLNANSENRIKIPKAISEHELYKWYKEEIKRIIETTGPFDSVAIKQNESMVRSCYTKLKKVMFFDCISTMISLEQDISVKSYIYSTLKTNAKKVEEQAETILNGKTTNWDTKIADAIVAAAKNFEL